MGISIDGVSTWGAYNSLESAQNDLSTQEASISSGSSLTAANNPSGLSIDQLMNSQVSGLQSASANAQNGVSLLQTADGGLGQTSSLLQNLRSLAVQAGNGALDSGSLQALGAQAGQDLAQIDAVSSNTVFGGSQLLNGSTSSVTFQTGTSAGDTTTAALPNSSSGSLGLGGIASAIAQGGDMSSVLKSIDAAAGSVNSARTDIGSNINSLSDTATNISSSITDLSQASSGIADTDVASSVMKMSQDKLKSDFAIGLMAQANGLNQQRALALLKSV